MKHNSSITVPDFFCPGTFFTQTHSVTELQKYTLYYHNWTLSNCDNERNNKCLEPKVFVHLMSQNIVIFNVFDFSPKAFTDIHVRTNMALKPWIHK